VAPVRTATRFASSSALSTPLISCEELKEALRVRDVRVIDATWYLPNSPFAGPGIPAREAYLKARIPGAVFSDLDELCLPGPPPHMLPDPQRFARHMAGLGVSRSCEVVVYDQHGLFSAPRLWATFRLFGSQARVLDGGLPAWQAAGCPVEEGEAATPKPCSDEEWPFAASQVWTLDQVQSNIATQDSQIVDMRPAPRFAAEVPEPRAGMRGGHIPESRNVPFGSFMKDGKLKDPEDLRNLLAAAGVDLNKPVVGSCGSGVTACFLPLALETMGAKTPWGIYDGSWSEWGARPDTPVATGKPKSS
jgi:thiosulfate/3-mercaptopyruvate sulfurtransferase